MKKIYIVKHEADDFSTIESADVIRTMQFKCYQLIE